ncbi:hypothetical protein E8E13_004512 [Curvularia kusanoi]|uniref:Complex 1 LYR protein domain-containing protein n=1 Tax=Curvularia kusanoi TaxID=90978 RepID=A0A9P4T610_CURKU|nr:hypothetical protein E8E13_004512 [Curvularia kusanoi]
MKFNKDRIASPFKHRFFKPKKSTENRVAAIALYRALLSGCSSAALPDDDRTSLQNAIRNKFRQNRKIQSPYQLGLSFKLGYETVDKLDAATTANTASTNILSHIISTLPRGLTRAPPQPRPLPPPPPTYPSGRHPLAPLPPNRAVLKVRPHATVSGQRKVPVLASANGVPFLRLTKPQPAALSRVLHQKLARRQENFHRQVELRNYWLPLAKQEDEWDALITAQLPERVDGSEGKWVDEVLVADKDNSMAYELEMRKDKMMVGAMMEIVDRETAMVLRAGGKVVRGRAKAPLRVLEP